jgi:hypothetical protein
VVSEQTHLSIRAGGATTVWAADELLAAWRGTIPGCMGE